MRSILNTDAVTFTGAFHPPGINCQDLLSSAFFVKCILFCPRYSLSQISLCIAHYARDGVWPFMVYGNNSGGSKILNVIAKIKQETHQKGEKLGLIFNSSNFLNHA